MATAGATAATSVRWSTAGTKRGTLIAGVAGILYAVLSVARVPLTGEAALPTWEASTAETVGFYEGLTFDSAFLVGFGMVTLGWLLYLVFIARFSSVVGHADGGSTWLGRVIVGLAVINVGLVFMYLTAVSTAARLADGGGVGPDSLLVLHGVVNGVIWLAMPTAAFLHTAIGVAIFLTRAFPGWLGVAVIATALLEMFAFFGPVEVWIAVGGLDYLWTLLLASIMLVRADRYSHSEPERPATRPVPTGGATP